MTSAPSAELSSSRPSAGSSFAPAASRARDGVWLRALDGSGDHQITRHGEDEIELLLGGWSPDSQTFLFYQAEAMREDESPPFPPDEQPGFQLASVKAAEVRRSSRR